MILSAHHQFITNSDKVWYAKMGQNREPKSGKSPKENSKRSDSRNKEEDRKKSKDDDAKEEEDDTTTGKKGKRGKKDKKRKRVKTLLIGDEAKREFSAKLMRGLAPIRLFGGLFGQFPFSFTKSKSGTYNFRFSWYRLRAIYFGISMLLSFYTLVFGGWSLFFTVADAYEISPSVVQREERWFEKSLLHRHLMWVISIFAAAVQSCFSYLYLYKNRYYIPSVLTFYTKAVQEMHMDISDSTFAATSSLILIYIVTFSAIIIMGITRFSPVTVGAPTLMGVYIFRYFLYGSGFWIEKDDGMRTTIQILGACFLVFIFTSSKIQMIIFVFHCKLLKNAFACWNGRAYVALMKGGKYFYTQEGKLTYKLLYKDHCVILDIMEATNRLCTGTMELYYGLQTATIFFEVYFFLRSARYGSDKHMAAQDGGQFFMRPNDWLPGALLAIQSIIFAMYTAKTAIDVGQEAMAGLDIVRKKTMLNRKTDDELLFQLSMQASFNSFQRFDISGGGYQYINTDWIMGYVNNIAGYFIILYQFQPAMDRSTKREWERRRNLGKFLANLEGLVPDHYHSSVPPRAIVYGPVN